MPRPISKKVKDRIPVQIPVAAVEYIEGGNTIWVQSIWGTILRIKCTGKIRSKRCTNPVSHADVIIEGDIDVCLVSLVRR